MLTLTKLRRKPHHFRAFTGLTVAQFEALLAELTPVYEAALTNRRQKPGRQREPGAGHPFAMALPDRLLMGLIYLRLYVSQTLLSYLFDLDESNISRELRVRLLPILQDVLPTPCQDAPLRFLSCQPTQTEKQTAPDTPLQPDPKRKKRINTLQELLTTYPEIAEVLLDATEQSVPQPEDKLRRKQAYSGKQQDHTVKTQIVATKKLILHVFGGLPGCINDMCVLRASGVLRQVPPNVRVRLDKGYAGADDAYPDVAVQQPIKKQRNQAVTILERAYNHALSVLRIPVEHHFARVKKWGAMAQVWRGKFADHEGVFCVIAGLLNFRQTGKFDLVG
jgi:hypothetical protein